MANLHAVIFDYYETLVSLTAQQREPVFDELARHVGVDLPPGEAFRHWRELVTKQWQSHLGERQRPPLDGADPPFVTFREVWLQCSAQLFRRWGVDAAPELGLQAYAGAHAGALAYPEVPAALDALRGRVRLAVLSDADSDFLHASIDHNGFSFDAVVDSEEVGRFKPHVSMFREACARLGVDPARAAYVGDSPWADVAGARNAGLRAVWINRHGVDWPDDIDPPEATIASLEELLPLFSGR